MSTVMPARDGRSTLAPLKISEKDDPRVVEEAARDDYSLHVAPRTWRLSGWQMSMAWSSLLTAMFWIVFAATVALAVGTRDALIGIALAVAAFGAVGFVLSVAASRTGLTLALFSRSMFGYFGASIATAVFAAGAIYYAVFESSVLAVAFQAHFGGSINTWYLVMAVGAIGLGLGGVRTWLDKINAALLPVFVVGLIAAVVWAIAKYGYSGSWAIYEPKTTVGVGGPGWLFAFTSYMGVWLALFYAFDFARLGKAEDATRNGFWLFGPPFWLLALMVNGVIGIFLGQTIPSPGGVSEASVVVGIVQMMGWAGLLFVLATQIKINSANIYLASTNLQSFFSRALRITLPRVVWTLVVAATMYVLMRTNVFTFLLKALQYQGAVIVGWIGIALVQIGYFRRRQGGESAVEFRPGRVPAANPGGLASWLISSAVGIWLIAKGSPTAVTWALPITFVLAAGLYAAALAAARPSWFTTARPNDPRSEVSDVWEQRILCGSCDRSYVAVEMDRAPTDDRAPICAQCAAGYGYHRAAQQDAKSAAPAGA